MNKRVDDTSEKLGYLSAILFFSQNII